MKFPAADDLSPLKFKPIYRERIWGGTLLAESLHRAVPAADGPIGEAWELVDRPEAVSVIDGGELDGVSFREALEYYGMSLTGPKVAAGARFPLLVKLIDAGERLSLQVHPDQDLAAARGHGAESKTEMWYIIAARKGARIMAGLSPRATRLQLRDLLNSPEIERMLQVYPSQTGDAYFIPSGTLHAIDAGNLILEIQQNSDTTYRISDWGRVDRDGKPRELHIEQGFEAINFANRTSPRVAGVAGSAGHNRKFTIVAMCQYFNVDDLRLVDVWYDNTTGSDSFHLISAVTGPVRLCRPHGELPVELAAGETALVPYTYGSYSITPLGADGETVVVKTTL